MRKTLAIPLLVLSFLLVVGVGSITARTLDKAGPKLANQVKEALSEVGILDDNRVILLTPSKNITSGSTKEVAWAIPSEKYSVEGRCVKNQLPTPLLKEVEAVGGVMNQSTNCKNVKTVIYWAPIEVVIETAPRIAIFSASEDLDNDTIKELIVAALADETDEDEEPSLAQYCCT